MPGFDLSVGIAAQLNIRSVTLRLFYLFYLVCACETHRIQFLHKMAPDSDEVAREGNT